MDPISLINFIFLGGLLGMLGQIIRTVVGLQKMAKRNELYDASRLIMSIIIGFTAGALAMIVLCFQDEGLKMLAYKDVLLLITTGYAGVDFIEGFFRKSLSKSVTENGNTAEETTTSEVELAPNNHPLTARFELAHHRDGEQEEQEVKIRFGKYARPEVVSVYALSVVKDLLRNSGNYSALITSTLRTPADQARAMYNNLIGGPEQVARQKALYGKNGDQIIDAFVAAQAAGEDKRGILNAMIEKIEEIGPTKVSRHMADFSKLVVLDIAPSSIKYKKRFKEEVELDERVSRFYYPPKDPAFHLEIPNKIQEHPADFSNGHAHVHVV